LSPDIALTHVCGLPFAETLHPRVEIVGTPLWRGVSDGAGWYRSRIVVAESFAEKHGIGDLSGLAGLARVSDAGPGWAAVLRPVVNNPESLSGWASLGVAILQSLGTAAGFEPAVSGSHVASLAAIADGRADIAAIDAVTFELLRRYRPMALEGIRVLGEGPAIPAPPLVCNARLLHDRGISVHALRKAVCDVIRDPAQRSTLDAVGIESFTVLSDRDYINLSSMAARAESVLPRRHANSRTANHGEPVKS